MKIKDIPKDLRPREKAMVHGLESLSDRELLSIFIRQGSRKYSALQVADQVLKKTHTLAGLNRVDRESLCQIHGISDIKATFVENGVTEKDFDGVINSFALNGMIAKFDKTTDKFDVHGTPTVIVNDKYELNMSEIGSADRFYEVVDYLLAQ